MYSCVEPQKRKRRSRCQDRRASISQAFPRTRCGPLSALFVLRSRLAGQLPLAAAFRLRFGFPDLRRSGLVAHLDERLPGCDVHHVRLGSRRKLLELLVPRSVAFGNLARPAVPAGGLDKAVDQMAVDAPKGVPFDNLLLGFACKWAGGAQGDGGPKIRLRQRPILFNHNCGIH